MLKQKFNIIQLYKDSFSGLAAEIWLLSLVTFINRAGAMVLPFLSLYLTSEEDYSLSTAGTILLFFGIGSFFGNYVGGILSDKIGPFRLQALSLLTTSIAFFALPYLHSVIGISMGLFITSLLADSFRPANMASVALLSSKEQRTKAIGVLRLAINLGFAAGPASGGLIAYQMGYHLLFVIDGASCFIAALFLLYFFRKYIKQEGEKKQELKKEQKQPSILQVLKDRYFLYFLFFIFILAFVFMQFFNSLSVFFKQNLLLREDQIGLLMALNGVLVVILELPMIHLLEKKNNIRLISIGCLLIAASYLVLIFESWTGVAVICLFFFTVGEILTLPFAVSSIINRAPEALRGRYMALYGMTISLCHMAAPVVGLNIAEKFSFSHLWIFVSIAIVFAAIGFWSLRKKFD